MLTLATPAVAVQEGERPTAPLVRIPFPQEDGTLTPYSFELGYPLVNLIYDTLLWRDAEGAPQPWLARSVETSGDARRVTIRLADGVRWHDGRPLTAADVAFTFDFVATHPHARFTPALSTVDEVVAADATTVIFDLRRPSPGFVDQPLADLPILPAHLWRGLPPGRSAPEGLPVGSGPYRLVEHQPGERYRFEASGDYFRGRPAVDAIEVPIIGDENETFTALLQNRVDMIPVSISREEAEGVAGAATRVLRGPSYVGTVLMFNLRQPPFDRLEVRSAIASALSLEAMARLVGEAVPARSGYLHPESPWSTPKERHVSDEDAAAVALRAADLPEVEVLAADNDPARLEAARQVVAALRRAGVGARVKALSRDQLSAALGELGTPATFQMAIGATSPLGSYDPDFLRTTFGSDQPDAVNLAGYRSPAFDRAAEAASTTVDPAARRAAVSQVLDVLAAELPVVPLFFSTGAYAYRPLAYDSWVFVKGAGILDKRSFVEPRSQVPDAAPPGHATSTPTDFPLGYVALGMLAVAVLLALVALAWRR